MFLHASALVKDLVVDSNFARTIDPNPQQFLIHDNNSLPNRIIVFASESALRHLSAADVWYMDGTFATSPPGFKQLYVIHAQLGDSAVSCIYAFLSDKCESTYIDVLTAVIDRCTTDFVFTVINATRAVFGHHITTHLCLDHLTQCTWQEIKLFVGVLDGLVYLDEGDVPLGMEYLKDNTPDGLEPLVDYFDATYFTGTFRKTKPPPAADGSVPPLRLCPVPPMYPASIWNVHAITLADGSRTNNTLEAWNNGFTHLVGHKHPAIFRFINNIQKVAADFETVIYKADRG
ncbi:uncharacterized protein LOC143032268 [Oratosquilla oratoria]|uniref:uncharacterized protein LOC143032268 n=1 Tax=Oratosquilla oratoria TaxID=337810 RepID=UPI003F75B643